MPLLHKVGRQFFDGGLSRASALLLRQCSWYLSTMRGILCCLLAVSFAFVGCGHAPLPPPPIHQAPAEIAALRIFVVNASHEAARVAEESTVTGYTIQMRGAVQRSLSRAGYTVVISPEAPTDLLAKVDVESPWLNKAGMASMTLATPEGIVIEQLSEVIVLDDHVDIDEHGPVAMVEHMARSPRIASFARGYHRGDCEAMRIPGRKILEVPDQPSEPAPVEKSSGIRD